MALQPISGENEIEIPFFPNSVFNKIGNGISMWWFEPEFSQSTFGRTISSCHSNACTLITVLTAAAIATKNINVNVCLLLCYY